jgi:endonuclease/exonuclease/phosphatase family metal-dependent hydrolase
MKIANWNIERLKHLKRLDRITEAIEQQNADILVLTEADTRVELPMYPYRFETKPLEQPYYKPAERRVIVCSTFPIKGNLETYDPKTACCPILETPLGPLAVYGTIIGIHGNRRQTFKDDLAEQVMDFDSISKQVPVCIAGDFNMSFSDNYYYTKNGRETLSNCFEQNDLVNLTASLPECIDHIVVSKQFIGEREVKLTEWNLAKSLSDHKGVCAEFIEAD